MNNKTRTRTFSISHITVAYLQEVVDTFKISKATIIRMAIYHGIRRLENGYRPVRDLNKEDKKKKSKLKIQLPENLWELFEKTVYSIEWNYINDGVLGNALERIPDGELINLFIDIELQPYLSVIYTYNSYKVNPDDTNYNKNAEKLSIDEVDGVRNCDKNKNQNTIYINADLTDYFYNACLEMKSEVGLIENQLWRYLLTQGLAKEFTTKETASIFSDYDILNEIDKLKIPRLKAFTLIRYLIENDILVWRK